jgi:ribonucleoside-triphosphate reductase (thioredoxin)
MTDTQLEQVHTLDIQPQHRFHLSDKFAAEWSTKRPDWGPIGEITYRRTYSRRKADGAYEEWHETVRRVVEGVYTYQKWHCRKLGLPWSDQKAQRSAQEMYELIFTMKFLPPGRGLWMCGTEYVEHVGSAALNNCAFVSTANINTDLADPFTFLMDFSMLGVGVGGNTAGAGKLKIRRPVFDREPHVVADSREGWVQLVARVLNSFAGKATYPARIDVSHVRKAGEPIKGFGGVSAGPQPLLRLVGGITTTLWPLIGKPITSSAITDLFNRVGVCIVAGNVRRSAEIMLGESGDAEFSDLKNPERFSRELNQFRWASNNSIYAFLGMKYDVHADRTAKNGEPGYFWLETARAYGRMKDAPTWADASVDGTNPCSEQSLEDHELCCLVETFPSRHGTYEEYERTLKFAYLYAKSITLVPTHNPTVNARVMRNRRIGCSQSGIIDSFAKHGKRTHLQWCDAGYEYLRKRDKTYADWLCVPLSRKITSVKPSGTVSLLPGVSPGIHYPHAQFYYRTIRISKTSPLIAALAKAGYRLEDDVADQSSIVAYFPIKEAYFDRAKHQVSMWEQLENAAALQAHWADNQVSITVTFRPHEAGDIKHALELYESRLKSVSFLPLLDHGYAQAPYQAITESEYLEASKYLKRVSFKKAEHENTDAFCDGDACVLPRIVSEHVDPCANCGHRDPHDACSGPQNDACTHPGCFRFVRS